MTGDMRGQAPQNNTDIVKQRITQGAEFDETADAIKEHLINKPVGEYFRRLLDARGITLSEAAAMADLDKDYGRQILIGERATRRDNYIKIAIALGLGFKETQSMLNYVQTGQIYVLRQRDAAIMFCLTRGYGLMETQLTLDSFGYEPLGDGGFYADDDVPIKGDANAISTAEVEQVIRDADDFSEVLAKTAGKLIKGSIERYFDELLEKKLLQRKALFDMAAITPNTGYQLLRGIRKSKNRDVYLKIAVVTRLDIDETQRMLKLLDVGTLYPVRERDAIVYFGISRGYGLSRIQGMLEDRGFLPL